jgi:nicotinate-nucleotide pyrophosphorylase (carboxylating)
MQISHLIDLALQEDISTGDITTDAIFNSENDPIVEAKIIAKQEGVVCGIDFLIDTYKKIDSDIKIDIINSNGHEVKNKDIIAKISGKSSSILKGERTALNFMGHLSGISTLTNKFLKKVNHTKAKILDTRKTTPAYRLLEKFAVRIGGGKNHRVGLFDMVMIKDNHISAAGTISAAIESVQNHLKKTGKEHIKIEVEVKNSEELKEALNYDIDRILLDNMTADELKKCVDINQNKCELEASGNVNLETVKEIAETGVDYISVGAITHSAPTFDFSMRFEENEK